MFLFVASLSMLLGVFPYQVFAGNWRWSYLAVLGFWIYVGYYSYVSLFYPHALVAEKEQNKRGRFEAKHWALVASTLMFCVVVISMMALRFNLILSLIGAIGLGALAGGATYAATIKLKRDNAQQAVAADRPKGGSG